MVQEARTVAGEPPREVRTLVRDEPERARLPHPYEATARLDWTTDRLRGGRLGDREDLPTAGTGKRTRRGHPALPVEREKRG